MRDKHVILCNKSNNVVGIRGIEQSRMKLGDRKLKKYEWDALRLTESKVGWYIIRINA